MTEAAQRDRAVAAMANELRQLVDTANAPIFGIDVRGMCPLHFCTFLYGLYPTFEHIQTIFNRKRKRME